MQVSESRWKIYTIKSHEEEGLYLMDYVNGTITKNIFRLIF